MRVTLISFTGADALDLFWSYVADAGVPATTTSFVTLYRLGTDASDARQQGRQRRFLPPSYVSNALGKQRSAAAAGCRFCFVQED